MRKDIIIPLLTAGLGFFIGFLIFRSTDDDANVKVTEDKIQIWTCSMHPQIRKNEPGDCPICGMDLIPLDENMGSDPLIFEMSEDAIRISNIETTVIGNVNGDEGFLTLSGRISPDETAASSLVTHIPGRIEKLYVSAIGESVSKGQKIAQIYSSELISAQGELLEAQKMKDSRPEILNAAINKLRYWKISESVINGILENQKIQEFFDVTADHSGVITKRRINVGDHLMKGGVLFDVQGLNIIWAVFDVYEQNLEAIKIGDEISFTTPAFRDKTFKSRVEFIDPIINASTRTASVRLEVDNNKMLLKPDMFVQGTLNLKTKNISQRKLLVPKSAVLWTGERSVVYVKLPERRVPSFEYREVTLGNASGDHYEVIEGLFSGDEVVTNGAFVIDAAAQLNNRSSMMNGNLLESEEQESILNTPDYSESTPAKFKNQIVKVINIYLELKDALVESRSSDAQKSAQKLSKALGDVEMNLITGEAHNYWMLRVAELTKANDGIKTAEGIDLQRNSFDELSEALISVSQSFGIYEDKLYVQFCPMANGDNGAHWLSNEAKIRNPYFGDAMLKCGVVKDSIKKRQVKEVKQSPVQGHNH
jgi:Cu(I)/Ag(I) efflux system membrane fusion protein